jgi:multicomponent Na+:H+ antiporter subunit B
VNGGYQPIIVRAAVKAVAPPAFLFAGWLASGALDGAGGGFVAGAAGAAALVLYALAFGVDAARRAVPTVILRCGAALGLGALLAFGLASLANGHALFDFRAFAAPGPGVLRLGAGIVEGALSVTTACCFSLSFYALAGRAADIRDEPW